MPNTLAHIGAQALITRGLIARADLAWIWAGCILPDLPWILQRVLKALPVAVSPIDLRLYAVAQSSLALSLVAAAGFAMLAPRARQVLAILALGCLLHLLLDATQTKWANGVVLFAPADWSVLNFGLYWPENWPSHALSLLGLGYVAWAAWRIGPGALHLPPLPAWRVAAAAGLFGLYALGPLQLMPAAEAADVHHAGTLRDVAARPGREIGFDRADLCRAADGTARLSVWTGETLEVTGLPIPGATGEVSIRGRFIDADRVELTAFHLHPAGRRDRLTMLGLGLIAVWWSWMAITGLRVRPRTPS